MIVSDFEDGVPAKFWYSSYWINFKLKLGQYDNFLTFLEIHQLSFLAEMELDFSTIPTSLHGQGTSENLLQYIANNTSNSSLILNFINYFILTIVDFRYSTGKKLKYSFGSCSTWQDCAIDIKSSYSPTTSTTTTTLAPTTTLSPTTTPMAPLFMEVFGQLYNF